MVVATRKEYHANYHRLNRDKILAKKKLYRVAHRDKILADLRLYYIKNAETLKKNASLYAATHRTERKAAVLQRCYGLSWAEYQKLLISQKERCNVCDRQLKLYVDHDHKTNKVRGLLCSNYNSGLGHFRDSSALLTAAISYLERC